jgi:putative transposase
VTVHRKPLLVQHSDLFIKAVKKARDKADFQITAWVILPDHVHMILNVPNGDTSKIMQIIKLSFSGQYKCKTGITGSIWQRRYWDHIIRSTEDMNRHIDYIHYNPVKHGLVDSLKEYSLSSFRKFCREGLYDWNWIENSNNDCCYEYGE